MPPLKLAILALLFAVGAAPCVAAPTAGHLKLERVVLLMRHGIRPPTKATVTPPGIASDPWPNWTTPYGELTEHGYQAVELLGRYDRLAWSARGLLPVAGCPGKGDVAVLADVDERTVRTGEALVEGLAPGCDIVNVRLPDAEASELFHELEAPGALDASAARAAILRSIGGLSAAQNRHRATFDRLQRILGCCSATACAASGLSPGCRIADMPSTLVQGGQDGRPRLTGPLDFGPTAAQTLMLEYVEGRPMSEVGWGRATPADIEAISALHALKAEILQRPPYVGAHAAANIARRMLEALDGAAPADGSKLTVLVGHDTNISDLSGLLGFDWRVASYPAHDPPPGGGIGFELLRDAHGARYVRVFFLSQTMNQMRNLTPLSLKAPPVREIIRVPGCSLGAEPTLCTLARFNAVVRARLPARVGR